MQAFRESREIPAIAVQVKGLTKHFGKVQALRGVDLDVPVGSITGILGPNGAGKTTFMQALVGAIRPTDGGVRVLTLDPVADAQQLRSQIGYMPQLCALYEDLTALENVSFFAQAHHVRDPKKAALEALSFVGLLDRARDVVFKFSGGMKQRVSLACALVHSPEVLFLDEPTAGVDPKLKEKFWQHFRELADRGVTVVINTHLMDEALLCDRLVILQAGRVLAAEKPREIMQRGRTTIKIWRGDDREEVGVHHYASELPNLLHAYNLDAEVTRIELEEESLESIIVQMIDKEGK